MQQRMTTKLYYGWVVVGITALSLLISREKTGMPVDAALAAA